MVVMVEITARPRQQVLHPEAVEEGEGELLKSVRWAEWFFGYVNVGLTWNTHPNKKERTSVTVYD